MVSHVGRILCKFKTASNPKVYQKALQFLAQTVAAVHGQHLNQQVGYPNLTEWFMKNALSEGGKR
jgi:hypothetical protein